MGLGIDYKSISNLIFYLYYLCFINFNFFQGFVKSFSKTTDELLLSATVKDVNDFFEQEKNFLIEYHSHLKDATAKADRMTKRHKGLRFIYLKNYS